MIFSIIWESNNNMGHKGCLTAMAGDHELRS